MLFRFLIENEEQKKELRNILDVELKAHFDKEYYKVYEVFEGSGVYCNIMNVAYFRDLQKSKEGVYEQNRLNYENKTSDEVLLHDFIEDVVENLSFVPKIEVS